MAPDSVKESDAPTSKAEGATFLRAEDGAAVFELVSGRYEFKSLVE